MWPEEKYIELPDLTMAYWEAGTPSPSRPSIILCHGFPEIAYSWRYILPEIAAAGFHVIAPDQRGFGKTGQPHNDPQTADGVALYDMPHLCGDMAHLLDALGLERAVFAGHDWGGIMMWQLPFYYPERIAGLIGVNTPFIPRLTLDPIDAFRAALGDDMYIVAFQKYGIAEAKLDADIARALRCFYRTGAGPQTEQPWSHFELLNILDLDEATWPGKPLLSAADFAVYEEAYTQSGFRGPINWYRNFSRNWELSASFEQKVSMPSLMISAENDGFLPPSMAEGMGKYVDDLEKHIIPNCGHWTQNERPAELNALMIDWLTRRFVM